MARTPEAAARCGPAGALEAVTTWRSDLEAEEGDKSAKGKQCPEPH